MNKIRIILSVLLVSVLLCVGCGGDDNNNTDESTDAPTTLFVETSKERLYPPLTVNQKECIEESINLIDAYLDNNIADVNTAIVMLKTYAMILEETNTVNSFEISTIADSIELSSMVIDACEKKLSSGCIEELRMYYDEIIKLYESYNKYCEKGW